MSLSIRGRLARRDGFELDVDLSLPGSGITAIVGTSGSGKSTLLRCVAGLEPPRRNAAGTLYVALGDQIWQDGRVFVPPHLRPLSLVLQEGALFPHLSVAGNLRYPRATRPGFALSPDQVIERFSLGSLLQRRPAELSGGQRQRVALARALLAPARLWLLDEPLSALDAAARRELAPEVGTLCRDLGLPVLYVSHSLTEVLQIADHLVVLEEGRVIAHGAPEQVSAHLDHALSEDLDIGGILLCRLAGFDPAHNLSEVRVGDTPLWIRGDLTALGRTLRVQIPAGAISVSLHRQDQTSVLNQLPCRIVSVGEAQRGSVLVHLDCAGQALRARITALSQERLGLTEGRPVYALIKTIALAAREHDAQR